MAIKSKSTSSGFVEIVNGSAFKYELRVNGIIVAQSDDYNDILKRYDNY